MVNTEDKKPKGPQLTSKDVIDAVIAQFNEAITAKLDGRISEEQFLIAEKQAAQKWNDWVEENRAKASDQGLTWNPDLRNYDFNKSKDLTVYQSLPHGLDLEGANLISADLSGTIMPQVNLKGADLSLCKIEGTTICSGSELGYSAFYKKYTDLSSAEIVNLEFTDNKAKGTVFNGATFGGSINFSGSDISGSDMNNIACESDTSFITSNTNLDGIAINTASLKRLPENFRKTLEPSVIEERSQISTGEDILSERPVIEDIRPVEKDNFVRDPNGFSFNIRGGFGVGTVNSSYSSTIRWPNSDVQGVEGAMNIGNGGQVQGVWDYKETRINEELKDKIIYRKELGVEANIPVVEPVSLRTSLNYNQSYVPDDRYTSTYDYKKDRLSITSYSATLMPTVNLGNLSLLAGASYNSINYSLNAQKFEIYTRESDGVEGYRSLPSNFNNVVQGVNAEFGLEYRFGMGITVDAHGSLPITSTYKSERDYVAAGQFTNIGLGVSKDLGRYGKIDIGLIQTLGAPLATSSPNVTSSGMNFEQTLVKAGFSIGVNSDKETRDAERLQEAKEKMEQLQDGTPDPEKPKPKGKGR